MTSHEAAYLASLKAKINGYAPVSEVSWQLVEDLAIFQTLSPGGLLLSAGQRARNFYYVGQGAVRAYVTDERGKIYNKNLFLEGDFCASTVSLLQATPSRFTLEALEETTVIRLVYRKFRALIDQHNDLKNFYIANLEDNWIIKKEQREVALVLENATNRYRKLLREHPGIDRRIAQQHLAAHLGITPTQLSRIKKSVKINH